MRLFLTAAVCGLLSSSAAAQPVLDGVRDALYGPPRAVQTVQTHFGDANPDFGSELDAAYAHVENGTLYLLLTGNLQNNFNRLNVFIDSRLGGQQFIGPSPSNDGWAAAYEGFTFDAGFAADFMLILRNGNDGSGDRFDIDFVDLGNDTAGLVDAATDVFGGSLTGANLAALPITGIGVAHDRSNTAGITAGFGPADQNAAAAVTTGIELSIPLAALGNPAGAFRLCAMINVIDHSFLSNQFLGGLAPPQPNLGGNVLGPESPLGEFDLNDFPGDQFFYAPCAGDLTGDSAVDVDDLNIVLSNWNTAGPAGDSNHDLIVDVDDLNAVLSSWACVTPGP